MTQLRPEEMTLICLYGGETRMELMRNLAEMTSCLTEEESDLRELAEGVMRKLQTVTEQEYEALAASLLPDFL